MGFLYLLLGHIIGDFVMQTDKIAANKIKYLGWNALHSFVVTICTLIFAIPFGAIVVVMVMLNFAVHFTIDWYKPLISKRYPLPEILYFCIDQAVHVSVIYLISRFSLVSRNLLFIDSDAAVFLIIIIFVTSFSAVLGQYLTRIFSGFLNETVFFNKGEKISGILSRLFMFMGLVLYSRGPFFIFLYITGLIMPFFMYKILWYRWMNKRYLVSKASSDIALSLMAAILLTGITRGLT